MPDRPKSPNAKRREQQRLNRLARVRAAIDAQDEAQHLAAAYEFARATIKKLRPDMRDGARRTLAEMVVHYALNELDAEDITRLEAVA